ncbi:MAG: SpoIIE family protein phosphatase [Bacteroidetes bacterium]|nr:SpoIIE family protein phosphatase [Bacteroidota bacterium]
MMQEAQLSESHIQTEFKKTTERMHLVACWVAIATNAVWYFNDYVILPERWTLLFVLHFGMAAITTLAVLLRNQLGIGIYACAFLAASAISVQNAYLLSIVDITNLQKFTISYITFFAGVGMLLLWNLRLSLALILLTILSNIVFYMLNSPLPLGAFFLNGGLPTLTVAVFSVVTIHIRRKLTYKELKSRLELELSKEIIEEQKKEVECKNAEMTSSLRYAKRLQEALLPSKNVMEQVFEDRYFILYKPRDIVSGDFYWAREINTTIDREHQKKYFLMAVADCTGHGVPGAFMSLLGSNFLSQSAVEKNINSPAEALDFLNRKIINTLNQGQEKETIRDGMDISFIALNFEEKKMIYAGANNAVYIVRKGELITLNPNKQAIGNMNQEVLPYSNTVVSLEKNDCIYLFTDGYADQFGGPKGKKLMRKQFENALISHSLDSMSKQKLAIEALFNEWKGSVEQTDDVCVIGIKWSGA